jgi:ubiquinone/menaquinone biosynthesis C-methylase UbiE/VanZ family protein
MVLRPRYGFLSLAYMAGIHGVSSIPDIDPMGQEWLVSLASNLLHIPVYAGLAFCVRQALAEGDAKPPRRVLSVLVFLAAAAYAAVNEWYQSFVPGQTASVGDFLLAAVGSGTMLALLRKESRPEGIFNRMSKLSRGLPTEGPSIGRAFEEPAKAHAKHFFSERVRTWAEGYETIEPRSLHTRNVTSRQRFALEMLEAGAPQASKVLDIGCGTGEMARELTRRGYEVWGSDIAEPMVRYARERYGAGRFHAGDLEYLPFRDNTFDAVVCLGVVEYLDTDERSLREIWRVLRPGGRAVISTPSAIAPLYHLDWMLSGLTAVVRPLYHFVKYRLRGRLAPVHQDPCERFLHRRFYHWRWLRLLRSVGLEPEDCVCHGWGWYRSRLGVLTERLARKGELVRHILERFLGRVALRRATNTFLRNRALNWVLSEQIVLVRALK